MAKLNGKQVYDHLLSIKNTIEHDKNKLATSINKKNEEVLTLQSNIALNIQKISEIRVSDLVKKGNIDIVNDRDKEALKFFGESRKNAIDSKINDNEKLSKFSSELSNDLKLIQKNLVDINEEIKSIENNITDSINKNGFLLDIVNQKNKIELFISETKIKINSLNSIKQQEINNYLNNKAFKFLLDNNFSTPEYNRNFISAFFDKKLANAINFELLYTRYKVITKYPYQLQIDIESQQSDLDKINPIIKDYIEKKEVEFGIHTLKTKRDTLSSSITSILKQLKDTNAQISDNVRSLSDFENNRDEFYLNAINNIKQFLKSLSIQDLEEYVNASKNKEDNIIFNNVKKMIVETTNIQKDISFLNKEKSDKIKELDKFNKLINSYKANDLDSNKIIYNRNFIDELHYSNSTFNDLLWLNLLTNDYYEERPTSYTDTSTWSSNSSVDSSWTSSSSSSDWSSSSSDSSSSSFSTSDSF